MQEDFFLHKNKFYWFTTSYLGKRLRFIFDLCIEVKIDSHWEAKYRKAIFIYSIFLPVFSFMKSFLKLVSYILDNTKLHIYFKKFVN